MTTDSTFNWPKGLGPEPDPADSYVPPDLDALVAEQEQEQAEEPEEQEPPLLLGGVEIPVEAVTHVHCLGGWLPVAGLRVLGNDRRVGLSAAAVAVDPGGGSPVVWTSLQEIAAVKTRPGGDHDRCG